MLSRGQRFTLNGLRWRVVYVTPSRAHCVASAVRVVTVRDRRTGAQRSFQAARVHTIDISPNSCVEFTEGRSV
jgi:hypothetical protein